jgi:hypothetical protein
VPSHASPIDFQKVSSLPQSTKPFYIVWIVWKGYALSNLPFASGLDDEPSLLLLQHPYFYSDILSQQFESLHQDPKISELLVNALDFIEEKMLRMGPEKRATSKEVVERFCGIYERASADAHYCLEPVPGHPKRVNTGPINARTPCV